MSNIEKYEEIMKKYRRGEYSNENLSLHDILVKAKEPNLLENMTIEELEVLEKKTFGMQKEMFKIMKEKREEKEKH